MNNEDPSVVSAADVLWAHKRAVDAFKEISKVVGESIAKDVMCQDKDHDRYVHGTGGYCCQMRQRFLVGIVAEDAQCAVPSDVVDFMDFDAKADDGRPILRIAFCPFCGKRVSGPTRVA